MLGTYVSFSPSWGLGPISYPLMRKRCGRIANASGLPCDQALTRYYGAAQARCAELPFCADLTEIFAGKTNLYNDPRHPNPDGYRLLAEAIFQELGNRGLLTQLETEESTPSHSE